jgi:hypothetical protein
MFKRHAGITDFGTKRGGHNLSIAAAEWSEGLGGNGSGEGKEGLELHDGFCVDLNDVVCCGCVTV